MLSNQITKILVAQMQVRLFHWQVSFTGQHLALGSYYSALSDLIDRLVEVYQGKNSTRVKATSDSIRFKNLGEIEPRDYIKSIVELFDVTVRAEVTGSDLNNILDEIVAESNKVLYLLTLK